MKSLVCCAVIVIGLASPPALARETPAASTLATPLNCQPPSSAPVATASQDQFDQYSWQMFIALNWPAQDGQRGTPNCSQQPGDAGGWRCS